MNFLFIERKTMKNKKGAQKNRWEMRGSRKKMKLRYIYHIIVLAIFLIQAYQSINKYFQYPIVYQESSTDIETIEKPTIQVCFKDHFNYEKASTFGYEWKTDFLTGMFPNKTEKSWKGLYGNHTFQKIQQATYEQDISKIEINTPSELKYKFGKGYCLKSSRFGKRLEIVSKEKLLAVFLVHSSTDTIISYDKSMHSMIELGSNTNGYLKEYEISYDIIDNTFHDGTKCIDYRQQEETYGYCIYRVFESYLVSNYGCYLPWMDARDGKQCEVDIPVGRLELQDDIYENIWALTSGLKIDLMTQCLPSCYQVKVKWEEKEHLISKKNAFFLYINDNVKTVRTQKAVYSFDIFMLMVELGSALGLWLGMHRFEYTMRNLGTF